MLLVKVEYEYYLFSNLKCVLHLNLTSPPPHIHTDPQHMHSKENKIRKSRERENKHGFQSHFDMALCRPNHPYPPTHQCPNPTSPIAPNTLLFALTPQLFYRHIHA